MHLSVNSTASGIKVNCWCYILQGTTMQCIVCRQTLASMLELQMHGKHHFQSPAAFYTCCVCLQSFDSKENLVSKLNTSGRTYYVCKPCYHGDLPPAAAVAVTSSSSSLSQPHDAMEYTRSHDPDCRCPSCVVKCENELLPTTTATPTNKKTFQCIKCQQSFATEYEIQMHVASHVMQEGNIHECKICNSIFDSPAKLQCHLIDHTFESQGGEIRCYVCNMLFAHASAVQMHVLEHGISARRYSCTLCPQTFFFSAELQNHMYCAHQLTPALSGGVGGGVTAHLSPPLGVAAAVHLSPPGGGIVFPHSSPAGTTGNISFLRKFLILCP